MEYLPLLFIVALFLLVTSGKPADKKGGKKENPEKELDDALGNAEKAIDKAEKAITKYRSKES